jgi:3-deoxy-D-manno-octulosonic-acid transferase
MFALYSLIYSLALLCLFPLELKKRPKGGRMEWLREKLGIIPRERIQKGAVWVHAVSVGETLAAMPFIKALGEQGHNVILSTITDTGRRVARERLGEDRVIYLPFDLGFFFRKAIRVFNPSAFILVETEIWPNAIMEMSRASVPVFIVNGRISEKSFKNYMSIRFFMKRLLGRVSAICLQDETYAMRALALGARQESVKITGNFKFEIRPREVPPPVWLSSLGSPVIVAGSTHKGEEVLIAPAIKKIKDDFPLLTAVFVPRHPERAAEVEDLLKKEGFTLRKSSELVNSKPETPLDAVLVDKVGELFQIFSAADIAIVGGSFIPHGGQNPLEPAYWGKPIITGAHMENFPFMGELVKEGGAKSVQGEVLYKELKDLLWSKEERLSMGTRAREFYQKHSGAVAKTLSIILEEISPGGGV